MTEHLPAIVLLVINMGLVWLLMAAPVGLRTVRSQAMLHADAERVWNAVSPLGETADWHHSVLKSRVVPGEEARVEQSYSHLDRQGQPIVRTLCVTERVAGDARTRQVLSRVIEDSALDAAFWKDFRECRSLEQTDEGVLLRVEQTDRYRGFAFLIFRFFALRREIKALARWLETGSSAPVHAGFEHPVVQACLALLSTLILWPFFGLTPYGLMMSSLLTVVILLHEFGHMAAYRVFGHKTVRMIFVPLLGGIAIGGRPYNSLFEVATCALMGAGLSAFFVPIAIALHEFPAGPSAFWTGVPLLVFLLILGAFNLLNLLPMNRFDGGQVLRQIFAGKSALTVASFLVTLLVLGIGWRAGVPSPMLLASLAVFTLLSLMGQGGVKPRHRLDAMTGAQRIVSAAGLCAAVAVHGYAIVYATDRLFSVM